MTYKDIFEDAGARERAAKNRFLQKTAPADDLRLFMTQDTQSCARQLRVPVLIARAELDRVVKKDSARRVYDVIPTEKEWYEIPGSGHSFPTDCSSEIAFEHIVAWMDKHMTEDR